VKCNIIWPKGNKEEDIKSYKDGNNNIYWNRKIYNEMKIENGKEYENIRL